jgi:hypothetical protein
VFFLFGSILFSPSQASAATPQDLSEVGTRAFDDLTRCINSSKKLDIYYLIDESGSLKRTDPTDTRAEILASSLRTLGAFKGVEITYNYGFFGDKFDGANSWKSVDAASVGRAADSLAREIRNRKNNNDTNWLLGVEGASQVLQEQGNRTKACQALIWLTDGGLWIGQKGDRTRIDQGGVDDAAQKLCSTVFETLRKRQVSVFGVLLKNTQALNNLRQSDPKEYEETIAGMAWMRPMVEGSGAVEPGMEVPSSCGQTPIPPNYAAGALLIAQDPVALALQFLILTSTTEGGTQINFDPNNILIEPGVRQFRLLSTSSTWELTSPTGATYSKSIPGLEVIAQNGVNQITVSAPVLELGKWIFTFEKKVASNNRLILFSGLEISLSESTLIGGTDGKISGKVIVEARLVANSAPVRLIDYQGNPNFKIFEIPSSGEQIAISGVKITNEGSFSVSFSPTTTKGEIELRIILRVLTKSGIALAPVSLSSKLNVKLPEDYPSIKSPIRLPNLEGPKGKTEGKIVVDGPDRGSGAACFDLTSDYGISIVQDSISRAGSYSWKLSGLDQDGCIRISEGGSRTLDISATNPKAADAQVIAQIPVRFTSDAKPGQDLKIARAIEFESKVIRVGTGTVTVLLFLIGILLPLGLIYLLYWITSKLAFGAGMQRQNFPVIIDSAKGILNRDGTKLIGTTEHFSQIPLQEDTRKFKEQGNGELRLRLSPIPLAEPWFEFEVAQGARVITMVHGHAVARKRFISGEIAPITQDMGSFWALVIRESDLLSPSNKSAVPALLVVYKRMRPGFADHNRERVEKVTKVAGIWDRIIELRATPLSGRAKRTDAVVAADVAPIATSIPPPPGMTPPPPPGMTPPPPPGMTPPPPPGR